ncbi:pyruvate kinase [Clostridium vincentii]|uniref:Pyruvate kinase n=1 Tax=Clostridium vincentii TaxID=52704 RepID=A0A2T0BBQ7_9CLOT|nr:pyruvate kinase [Clostridium vincentii]PRR81330.1 Pyruvate kinase [Clostridium vincentii]
MDLICSIGPRVNTMEEVHAYVKAGMTMPRFNFSHVDYIKFRKLINGIQKTYPEMKILQDLQGNKLRISRKFNKEHKVYKGDKVIFCLDNDYEELISKEKIQKIKVIPLSYEGVFADFKNVKIILMKDATMEFKLIAQKSGYIYAITERGGILRAEKGVNAPLLKRQELRLTNKDKNDISWGIEIGVDIICLSYVTSVRDMIEVREYINRIKKDKQNFKNINIWAKIECMEGVENFDEILEYSDGILIGRGDLNGEATIEDIPIMQQNIIAKMQSNKKPLIIGTYVLDSMKRGNPPSLAEVNDIYNFTKNKVDGFMLSTEITISNEPVLVIKKLKELILKYITT